MKKLLTVAACGMLASALAATPAAAQTIGFKVGPTFSEFSLDDEELFGANEALDRITSFGGGGFIRFGAGGLNLQVEALAFTKGTKFTDEEFGDAEAKFKLQYIEIPVTAMFSLGRGPYIFGGPTVSFETGCKVSFEFEGDSASGDCDETEGDEPQRKKLDVGVTAGAGLQFPMGPGSALLEARHTWGLTNLNDDPNTTGSIKNRSIAVFVGYAISIGRR